MGNISPRQSKSYHDGLNNHLSLSAATASTTTTPNRSSWKKQLQMINETLNIKKFSFIHHQGRQKRSRATFDENHQPRKLSTSMTTQNFQELNINPREKSTKDERWLNHCSQENQQRKNSFKKSLSLFTIKQPLADSTNKRNLSKFQQNPTNIIREKDEDEPQVQQATTLNSQIKQSDQIPSQQTLENQGFHQQKRRQKFEITTVSNALINKRHSAFLPPSCHLSKSQSQYSHQQYSTTQFSLNKAFSSSTKQIRTIEKHNTRKTIIQASTSELLRCLGEYLCSSCSHLLPVLDPMDCILWIKGADRQLVLQGWQEQVFVNPANIVFVYLLLRETLTYVVPSTTIKSVTELHAIILTCLYLAFSYMGNEITYPLKPFVTDDETRDAFWQRVVLIMGQLSAKMLAINQNPKFFTECFSELKTYNLVH